MRLSLMLPCVVLGGLIGVSVYGQSGEEPTLAEGSFSNPISEAVEEPALPQPQSFTQPVQQPQSSAAEHVVQEEQELRRQYRKLMELKSGLMGRSELRAAINGAVEDINELRAAEKLDEARTTLLELVKTHPQSKAAATARAMLQAVPQEGAIRPTRDRLPFSSPKSYLKLDEETGLYVPAPFSELRKKRAEPATEDAPIHQQ